MDVDSSRARTGWGSVLARADAAPASSTTSGLGFSPRHWPPAPFAGWRSSARRGMDRPAAGHGAPVLDGLAIALHRDVGATAAGLDHAWRPARARREHRSSGGCGPTAKRCCAPRSAASRPCAGLALALALRRDGGCARARAAGLGRERRAEPSATSARRRGCADRSPTRFSRPAGRRRRHRLRPCLLGHAVGWPFRAGARGRHDAVGRPPA